MDSPVWQPTQFPIQTGLACRCSSHIRRGYEQQEAGRESCAHGMRSCSGGRAPMLASIHPSMTGRGIHGIHGMASHGKHGKCPGVS